VKDRLIAGALVLFLAVGWPLALTFVYWHYVATSAGRSLLSNQPMNMLQSARTL